MYGKNLKSFKKNFCVLHRYNRNAFTLNRIKYICGTFLKILSRKMKYNFKLVLCRLSNNEIVSTCPGKNKLVFQEDS